MSKTTFISILVAICLSPIVPLESFGQNSSSNTLAPAEETVEMRYDDLPRPILKVLKTDRYAGWKVDKVYKVGKRTPGSAHHYMIRYETGKQTTDVYLDEHGNTIDPQGSASESEESTMK